MIKNYRGISGVKILIYVPNLFLFLSLLLLSSCAYASNEKESKQIATSYNASLPELSITEDKEGSLVATYQTADGIKTVHVSTIKDYSQGLQYFDFTIRPENTNYLLEDNSFYYMLGNFTSDEFLNPDKVLQVKVTKDDVRFFYYIQFAFDRELQNFVLSDVYQLSLLDGCAFTQAGIKKMQSPYQNKPFSTIDFKTLHHSLYSESNWFNNGEKIIPDILLDKYQLLMDKNTSNKQAIVESLIQTNESDGGDRCMPEEYIDALYYYEDNIELSNNLAFYFGQYGYNNEAIELLNSVIRSQPDRAVAYLNIADSYQALGEKVMADKYYQQYYEKMANLGKDKIVPKRVIQYLK